MEIAYDVCVALTHFRYRDSSRFLWVEDICINKADIPERSHQVSERGKICQNAKAALIWTGPDTPTLQAQVAVDSIQTISDFLCQTLDALVSDLN